METGNERKCIGVFIAKPDRDYQKGVLCGIYKAAFEHGISVAVFSSTVNGGTDDMKASELEIFTLPNFDRLAGAIYVPMTFDFVNTDDAITKPLMKAVKEKGFPAITIDDTIEGLPCVVCDDTETIRSSLEHLIIDHGCKDIAYMTGPEGHPHADARLRIFRETMEKHGLEVLPDRVFHGDFWMEMSDEFAEKLRTSPYGLPEAIACANSYMAFSLYQSLEERGIRIPDDVLLVNYSDENELFDFITGSSKEADIAGYTACKTLIGMINGTPPAAEPIKAYCGSKLSKSLSCGCITSSGYNFTKVRGKDLHSGDSYFGEFNLISTDLLSRPNYREMFYGINWYTFFISGFEGIYFCLCEGWNDPIRSSSDEIPKDYTDRMRIYFSRVDHEDGSHTSTYEAENYFPVEEMFPKMFDPDQPPASYIFRPLHFNDRNFGYVVVDNGSRLQTYNSTFDYWMKDVSNAIESQRRLQNMKYMYNSDLMTGTYNRNGFYQLMPELLKRAVSKQLQFFAAVCDLNGMKYINDTFGHNEGDIGIKTAAKIICDAKLNGTVDEKVFRIGGDEFVKAVIGHFTDEDVAKFRSDIEHMAADFNANSGKPYPVYISAGICVKNYDEDFTLDSMIHEADEEMFRQKAEIRRRTGFFPKR